MRLFSAICLSAEATERLSSLHLRLSAPKDGLRWSAPAQWHITLSFYGDCDATQQASLQASLSHRPFPPAQLAIEQLGLFATKGILLAEIVPSPSLLNLQAEVTRAAATAGLQQESRPFLPHITLARSRGGKAGQQTIARWRSTGTPAFGAPVHWLAHELVLMESSLLRTGASYSTLARTPLQPPQ